MSDIPYDRLVEPEQYEDWHEWDCSTSMGPPGPFPCDCKLSKGWTVFLLPPESEEVLCRHCTSPIRRTYISGHPTGWTHYGVIFPGVKCMGRSTKAQPFEKEDDNE